MSAEDASSDDPIRAAIDAAEEVRDPLDGLAEAVAADTGAAFTPEVLVRLAALKRDDRPAFEALRVKLKKDAKLPVTTLDRAIARNSIAAQERRSTQADVLIEFGQAAQLFHALDGVGFADVDVNGHRETWPIRSASFRRWLAYKYFVETRGAPNSEAMGSAINVIEANAIFAGPERQVHTRVGGLDGRIYVDVGDECWRAVEIDATGWRVIDNPPVRFRRASGMRPMAIPVRGGSVDALREFLNVQADHDFVLVVAWALACLRDRGPYPILVLSGEQGAAKSTFADVLRALIDPNAAPKKALPREDRDLFIAARNRHLLAFDNVSFMPDWISDTLCRLATGGGFAARKLCTDEDEVLFYAQRPIILNGIEDIVTRPDLADRALFINLEYIPDENRRTEEDLWAAFKAESPRILGALFDAVTKGLAELPATRLEKPPRMADFAVWSTACENALWPPGTFSAAYSANRVEATENVIDMDPVAAAIRMLMTERTTWSGTATQLAELLPKIVGARAAKERNLPTAANVLSNRLRRAKTFLRKIGIEITLGQREGHNRDRIIHMRIADPTPPETVVAQSSASSASSADLQTKACRTETRAVNSVRANGSQTA